MHVLVSCRACGGFVPAPRHACPHCDAPVEHAPARFARLARVLALAAGGGALMLTLMACYGLPPCDKDEDGDRACSAGGRGPRDCNDQDPTIHPFADDPEGDGIDQNCDGVDGVKSAPAPAPGGASDAAPP